MKEFPAVLISETDAVDSPDGGMCFGDVLWGYGLQFYEMAAYGHGDPAELEAEIRQLFGTVPGLERVVVSGPDEDGYEWVNGFWFDGGSGTWVGVTINKQGEARVVARFSPKVSNDFIGSFLTAGVGGLAGADPKRESNHGFWKALGIAVGFASILGGARQTRIPEDHAAKMAALTTPRAQVIERVGAIVRDAGQFVGVWQKTGSVAEAYTQVYDDWVVGSDPVVNERMAAAMGIPVNNRSEAATAYLDQLEAEGYDLGNLRFTFETEIADGIVPIPGKNGWVYYDAQNSPADQPIYLDALGAAIRGAGKLLRTLHMMADPAQQGSDCDTPATSVPSVTGEAESEAEPVITAEPTVEPTEEPAQSSEATPTPPVVDIFPVEGSYPENSLSLVAQKGDPVAIREKIQALLVETGGVREGGITNLQDIEAALMIKLMQGGYLGSMDYEQALALFYDEGGNLINQGRYQFRYGNGSTGWVVVLYDTQEGVFLEPVRNGLPFDALMPLGVVLDDFELREVEGGKVAGLTPQLFGDQQGHFAFGWVDTNGDLVEWRSASGGLTELLPAGSAVRVETLGNLDVAFDTDDRPTNVYANGQWYQVNDGVVEYDGNTFVWDGETFSKLAEGTVEMRGDMPVEWNGSAWVEVALPPAPANVVWPELSMQWNPTTQQLEMLMPGLKDGEQLPIAIRENGEWVFQEVTVMMDEAQILEWIKIQEEILAGRPKAFSRSEEENESRAVHFPEVKLMGAHYGGGDEIQLLFLTRGKLLVVSINDLYHSGLDKTEIKLLVGDRSQSMITIWAGIVSKISVVDYTGSVAQTIGIIVPLKGGLPYTNPEPVIENKAANFPEAEKVGGIDELMQWYLGLLHDWDELDEAWWNAEGIPNYYPVVIYL